MGGKQPQAAITSQRVAGNIRRLMVERRITKAQLHRSAGLARATFHDKLDNRPWAFTVEELTSIADALEVAITDLFTAA